MLGIGDKSVGSDRCTSAASPTPAASQQQPAPSQSQQQPVKYPFSCKLQDGTPFTPGSLQEFEVRTCGDVRVDQRNGLTNPFQQTEVKGPDGNVISSQADDRGGQYGVVFMPGPPGRHHISVKWNGQPVQGSTFGINIGGKFMNARGERRHVLSSISRRCPGFFHTHSRTEARS